MFQFLGYNFLGGPGALNVAPGSVENITNTRLTNAIYDHFNVTYELAAFNDATIPTEWTYDTILNATFNGTVGAGNLEYAISQVDGIKIKRRQRPSARLLSTDEFNWITLKYIKINTIDDLAFSFYDFLNAYGVEYEYALVPVVKGIEGRYIVDSIMSKFEGVFIGDSEQTFKFLYGNNYSSNARNQQTGQFTPLGRQYPIIIANGIQSYESGNFVSTVVDDGFENTGTYNKIDTTRKKIALKNFLTNKKPKVLKDWNGNIWLVMTTDNVQVNYREGSGMSLPDVSFNWIEVGNSNSQSDLYNSGLIDVLD